jgi:hypothetical protein
MPKGRPKKWAAAQISEPVDLGKAGITILLWDKWGRKRSGKLIVSVGGLRWYPYKAKKPYRMGWDRLTRLLEEG